MQNTSFHINGKSKEEEKVRSTFKKDQDDGPSTDKPQMMIVNEDGEEMDESGDKVADLPDKFEPMPRSKRQHQSVVIDSTA